MKIRFITAAVLAAMAGVAHAQSSVTLYGVMDAGFLYSNNTGGSKQYAMQAGWLQGNRWGMLGTEDLGAGYKAIFRLEGGYSPLTGALGQGGALFGRQAYVWLDTPYRAAGFGHGLDRQNRCRAELGLVAVIDESSTGRSNRLATQVLMQP